jgi:hypothetical protein
MTDDGIRFTVMSYNVLSPKLADSHQYLYGILVIVRQLGDEASDLRDSDRGRFANSEVQKVVFFCN